MSINEGGSIAVFCGARPGVRPDYLDFARDFGRAVAGSGLDLVYGAGGVGIMGAVADGVLEGGGGITGVIPHALHERERADQARGAVFVVGSMHDRKALMYQLASAFAVLPGGIGTLDELMEVATWNQLGMMAKPIVIVNHRRFFTPLLAMLDHLAAEGFLSAQERSLFLVAECAEEALAMLGFADRSTAGGGRLSYSGSVGR